MPLGCSEGEVYRQVAFPLETGDMVVFYADGVTEARNSVDRMLATEARYG